MGAIHTIWLRNVKRFARSKSRLFGSLTQPLFFLIVLGFGLNSLITIPGQSVTYMKFLIPGIVAMTLMFSSIFSGIQVIWDKQFGFLKETLVAPVSRVSIMIGQTLGGATVAIVQGLLIFIISLFIDISILTFPGIFIALLFMLLIGIGFTAFGVLIASRMEDMQGFQLIINLVIFPIFFLSGALFPMNNAPAIIKILTYIDPLTYGVEGMRYGLLGISQINPWICFLVLGLFTTAMVILGAIFFRKIKV